MSIGFKSPILMAWMALSLVSCTGNHTDSNQTSDTKTLVTSEAGGGAYQEFAMNFKLQPLPLALPVNADTGKARELDRKYIKGILDVHLTPAFGNEDILPELSDNMDAAKYYACARVTLDSFSGYIVDKQGEDDYYYLCLFDKNGRFTDGMCIAFKEGTDADGTARESAINEDGSIEISQYNIVKGKPDHEGAERHFYEITNEGKIRDLKNNASPSHT